MFGSIIIAVANLLVNDLPVNLLYCLYHKIIEILTHYQYHLKYILTDRVVLTQLNKLAADSVGLWIFRSELIYSSFPIQGVMLYRADSQSISRSIDRIIFLQLFTKSFCDRGTIVICLGYSFLRYIMSCVWNGLHVHTFLKGI